MNAGLTPMGWVAVLVAGMLFGAGLAASSMVRPEVVLSFLRFQDFGLLLVMGAAAAITAIAYALAPRALAKPPFGPRFGVHPSLSRKFPNNRGYCSTQLLTRCRACDSVAFPLCGS